MRLPTLSDLEANLRTTLVVHAEVQYLGLGGELGKDLAMQVTGQVVEIETIPTDCFGDAELSAIPVEHLAIHKCIVELRALLDARSLGYGPRSGALDGHFIEQEYLDLLELYLSALPDMTFGGFDWGNCRLGAMRDLLLAGKAWHHLASVIDEGASGVFEAERLTATDLALIADIEVGSVRNMVGPNKKLRSEERYLKRKSHVSERSFATINRFDALDWLAQRKEFGFAPIKAGLFADRIAQIDDPIAQGRAALIAALVRGHPFAQLAKDLDLPEGQLRELGDGSGREELAAQIVRHVVAIDQG